MKTSILPTLAAAAIALSPALIMAQSSTANPSGTPQGGRGETAGQPKSSESQTETDTAKTDPAVPNTDASANRNATAAGDQRTEAQKRNADGNDDNAKNRRDVANDTRTPEERKAAREARQAKKEQREKDAATASSPDRTGKSPMTANEKFEKLDTDKSQGLTQAEFEALNKDAEPTRDASSSTTGGRNGLGPGTPGSTAGSPGGVLTLDDEAEQKQHMADAQTFKELDKDSNGILVVEEFALMSPPSADDQKAMREKKAMQNPKEKQEKAEAKADEKAEAEAKAEEKNDEKSN